MAVDLNASAVSAPPRSARASQAQVKRASGKQQERRETAEGIFQLAGFGCIIFRQYADAGAIGMHSPPIVDEVIALSEKNTSVANALDYLAEAGPYAGLVIAVMPLVLQLAANHGVIKAEMTSAAGVVPPAALESQVKADMARQAANALQAQRAAEQELATLAAMAREDASQDEPESPPEPNGQAPVRSRGRKTSA